MPTDEERLATCQRFVAGCQSDYAELHRIVEQHGGSAIHPIDMTRLLAAHASMLQFALETIADLQTRLQVMEWKLRQ